MRIYLNKSKGNSPISEMCKAIRKEQYITQEALAKLIGVNASEVSYIERGYIPDSETVVKISDLYKDTPVYQNQTRIRR